MSEFTVIQVRVPITRCPHTGEELLTEEACELIDMVKRIELLRCCLRNLMDAATELLDKGGSVTRRNNLSAKVKSAQDRLTDIEQEVKKNEENND